MGDLISSHLDEGKREIIKARTGEVIGEFGRLYEQQYAVALFNKVRFDIEGGGGPQPQLLRRKAPLENRSIFSGALFQFLEENKKWRNRFLFVPDSYNINYYDNKASHERGLHPKGTINCAGYKVLTSMDQYLELLNNSLPDVKAKVGNAPFLKCATEFLLILWHPYARHYYFCVVTEKEQKKWHAVFQDCVRHTNDGLLEESKVQTPAFTDSVRLFRQAHGQYGTWEMMCGTPPQILANLVMETLLPEVRDLITPGLKGKMYERQRNWMLICDAVYGLVVKQAQAQYEAVVQSCEAGRPLLEASIRKDMDQIITSKEHVSNKIKAVALPKAEKLLKVSIQPYISSILEALMEPTSRGFSEVRDVFFRELVDMSKNTLNDSTKEKLGEHMEKISMLAFHPVKMQSCYEKVEDLSLDGLQQRFDVSSPSVFVQRAQILMREQMDDAVYTFEQILHQSLEDQGPEGLCKSIQRCQDRVIKKFDYDSSTVRKRFFREALLQIFIPYMLKQLTPSVASELPRFQELIFEDFSRFILVENIFEEVVLHSVMKDIMMAVKEAAVQRRHNLYRDSIVLTSSDPNLHLLGDNTAIDWAGEYGTEPEEGQGQDEGEETGDTGEAHRRRRMKQVVSMIQLDGSPIMVNESCLEVPSVDGIPEEGEGEGEDQDADAPSSPEIVHQDPVKDNATTSKQKKKAPPPPVQPENSPSPALTNGSVLKGGESVTILSVAPEVQTKISEDVTQDAEREKKFREIESSLQENTESAIESAIQEIENAVQEEDSEPGVEVAAVSQETAVVVSPSSQEVSSVPSSKEKESLKTVQEEASAPAALTQENTSPSSEAVSSLLSTQMEAVAVTPIAQEEIPAPIPTALDTELLVPALTPTEIPAATTTALETEKVPVPAPMPEESESTESTSDVQRANPQPTVDLNSLPPPPPHATSEAVEKAAPSTEEPEAAEVIPEGVTVAQEGAAAQKKDSVTG
ncbi:protein Niban 2-like [Salvelinus fontinalis]|uniref:protein Niban 2-like n=1 Tax=Salvelinus fontinalis TaxID=8038 RepID=UPI00248567FC|nr:protein Niban 2-like [Salvelinus fontinalis]